MASASRFWIACAVVLLASATLVAAADPLAFVTEVKGAAEVTRADGTSQPAQVGARLFAGDLLKAAGGEVVVVYVSGRSAKVATGDRLMVEAVSGQPSTLVARLRETLDEIDAPKDAKSGPVVHGMAREAQAVANCRPANTWISRTDFEFSWNPVPGVSEYDFNLATSQGRTVMQQTTREPRLPANKLPLERGRRYVWKVLPHGGFVMGAPAANWVEVVAERDADTLRQSLKEVEETYRGATQALLQAAVLYRGGFYHEAQSLLEARQANGPLSPAESSLLAQTRGKMAP